MYLQQFNEVEQLLEDKECYPIDPISLTLLNTLDVDQLVNRRRQNFQVLLDGLSDLNYLSTPVKELKDDVCPIFLSST